MTENAENITDQLRLATPEDAQAISDLVNKAYTPWVPVLGRTPIPMLADYDVAIAKHRFDLLEAQDRLVALVETHVRPDDFLIVNIAVDPDLQGTGMGRELLQHADALAIAARRQTIRLYTASKMASNVALYKKLGFTIEKEEPYEGDSLVHFMKIAA